MSVGMRLIISLQEPLNKIVSLGVNDIFHKKSKKGGVYSGIDRAIGFKHQILHHSYEGTISFCCLRSSEIHHGTPFDKRAFTLEMQSMIDTIKNFSSLQSLLKSHITFSIRKTLTVLPYKSTLHH